GQVVHRHGVQVGGGVDELVDELALQRRGGSLLLGVLGRIGLPGGDARTVEVRHRGGGEVAVHHGAVPLLQERLGDLAGDRGVAEGRGVDVQQVGHEHACLSGVRWRYAPATAGAGSGRPVVCATGVLHTGSAVADQERGG